ncbi:MAG: ATP-binding protein, partial [Saprospiraceae bacterium]
MKNLFLILILLFASSNIYPQQQKFEDSLRAIINKKAGDISEVNALALLANQQSNPDSKIYYVQKGMVLAQKLEYKMGLADCFLVRGMAMYQKDISENIQDALNALTIYKELNDNPGIIAAHLTLQGSYREIGDYKNALQYAQEGVRLAKVTNVKNAKFILHYGLNVGVALLAEISQTYLLANQLDSAKVYAENSIKEKELVGGAVWNFPYYLLSTIQNLQGNYKSALEGYRLAIPLAIQNGFFRDTLQIYSGMSTTFKNLGLLDSSIYYASLVERSQNPGREIKTFLEALNNLAEVYKLKGDKDSTLKYIEMNYINKDSIFSRDKERRIQNITFNEKLNQQKIISVQEKFKSRIQFYALVAGLLVLLLITGILWRNNLQKQKAKSQIEKAYTELKSTQSQLIQSEKMASLGELTAGIAHEIQNPLNFVNNFSELSVDLAKELKEEVEKLEIPEKDKEYVSEIISDLSQNQEKINHHGKRASGIVKGMLEHSRASSGKKELTDINKLCDEYLRLAYHGLRAKDKSFKAEMITQFDPNLPKIEIVPQDIGRVILNLITNAFYAVNERANLLNLAKQSGDANLTDLAYGPKVTVTTHLTANSQILISVKDNGSGIPEHIKDKIFQ